MQVSIGSRQLEDVGSYEDKVRSDISSTRNEGFVCAIQVSDIVRLQDQDDDPVYTGDHAVEAEWCRPMVVLSPYRVTMLMPVAVRRFVEGVVCTGDDNEQP